MKTLLSLIALTLFVASCASYAPVQHIGGERHPQSVALETCSFDILTFPVDPKLTSIHGGMNQLNINSSQVYSIEYTYWMYLWPLVAQKCVYFNMNASYSAPAQKVDVATPSKVVVPAAPAVNSTRSSDDAPGKLTGNMDADFAACDDLMRMERSQCRKKVYNHYRDLEKQKK